MGASPRETPRNYASNLLIIYPILAAATRPPPPAADQEIAADWQWLMLNIAGT